jgi:hypothetical protein
MNAKTKSRVSNLNPQLSCSHACMTLNHRTSKWNGAGFKDVIESTHHLFYLSRDQFVMNFFFVGNLGCADPRS